MNRFETEYRIWLDKHIAQSSGERHRRLKARHGFGEKLLLEQAWWPVVQSLENLHPEYEFVDPEGNYYFMDFAYVRMPAPICLESDSFGSHARDADRDKFSRGLDRQNEIVLADWRILRFSIDKLKENPLACQKQIRRMLENWYGEDHSNIQRLSLYQREIVRLATRSPAPITVSMVCECLGRNEKLAREQLQLLVQKGILETAAGEKRIRSYRLRR
ncbi:DNA-binding response regulator [Cohnella cholangitidis]|uniref:DNA-binding response regulator n=1 Tax=Cohnella cholangitidis TaxID=2598458 RepID=A0A7G5BWP8_9BACL|nr:DNA-binding response regulator [Cohnella cholangitidis]QMV41382.1 DNA-binding response regulator [Cohnella cholangitidis]